MDQTPAVEHILTILVSFDLVTVHSFCPWPFKIKNRPVKRFETVMTVKSREIELVSSRFKQRDKIEHVSSRFK